MTEKIKLLLCGAFRNEEKSSWDKTNGFLFRALEKKTDCVRFDYSFLSKSIQKVYQALARILYGQTIVRDPLYDFLLEWNFKKQFKKLTNKPDIIIHSSSLCVPKGFESISKHVLYTDATIMGAVRYNEFKPDEKALHLFTKESVKYINRLRYVFTFNEWTKKSLAEDFKIDERKIINVGFGANLNPYFGEKNYSNNILLVVLRRGLEKKKGLYLLLDAFKIAYKVNPAIKLSVVGTTLDPIEGVTYYEGLPREKTIELFQQAALYVMPALFEPNGMVYIEALACKTPILGLNRLAFPEFCGYGQYGFISGDNPEEIANMILSALNNPQQLKIMGETGQQFVMKRFNWDNVVDNMLKYILN